MTAGTAPAPTTPTLDSRAGVRAGDPADPREHLLALHERARVPLGSHAREVLPWAATAGRAVSTLAVDRPGAGLGAAALLEERRRRTPLGHLRVVRLAGHGHLDHQRLVAVDDDAAASLAEALLSRLGDDRAWYVDLEQLPDEDPVVSALLARVGTALLTAGDPSPQLDWPLERDEHTWARKKARQNARRAERALDSSGARWQVDRLVDPDELHAALPETLRLRRARELALSRADELADPRRAQAHTDLVADLAGRGQVELWRLVHDGELLAYLLAAHDHDRVRLLDHRMRPGAEDRSPSDVLVGRALQRWHADPAITGVDFGRGRTGLKQRLSNNELPTQRLQLWSHPRLAAAHLGGRRRAEQARQRLRDTRDASPAAQQLVRAVRRAQTSTGPSRPRGTASWGASPPGRDTSRSTSTTPGGGVRAG